MRFWVEEGLKLDDQIVDFFVEKLLVAVLSHSPAMRYQQAFTLLKQLRPGASL